MPSITINFTNAQTQRIKDAATGALNPGDWDEGSHVFTPRPATVEDIKDFIIRDLKRLIVSYERNQAKLIAHNSIDEVDFT